jgi:hypothetical protein
MSIRRKVFVWGFAGAAIGLIGLNLFNWLAGGDLNW